MMTIDEAKLNAYLDGELLEAERHALEQELATSPQAQATLTRLRQETDQLNRALALLAPPPSAYASAWPALKRLRTHLNLPNQEPVGSNGATPPQTGANVWESPTLLYEMKASLSHLRRRPSLTLPGFRPASLALAALTLVVLALAITWGTSRLSNPPGSLAPASAQLPTPTPVLPDTPQLPPGTSPISATFEAGVELIGYQLPNKELIAGEPIPLTLYWRSLQPLNTQYTTFAHLVDPKGVIISQHDTPLLPARTGAPGEIIPISYALATAPGFPGEQLEVIVGVYESTQAFPLPLYPGYNPAIDSLPLAQVMMKNGIFIVAPPLATLSAISTTVISVPKTIIVAPGVSPVYPPADQAVIKVVPGDTTLQGLAPLGVDMPVGPAEIVIVLDISGSMSAEDFTPDRLNAAKAAILDYIDQRPEARIGFVSFAGEVVGQIQPTLDHTMLKGAVEATQLSWDIGLDSGTALGLGINEAVELLQDPAAGHKMIILLTDGANNTGSIDPFIAAKNALAYGIQVNTIGLAQQGLARLVFPDGRIEYRASEIDEAALQKIAEMTGGRYYRAEDNESLKEIYNMIGKLEGIVRFSPGIPVPGSPYGQIFPDPTGPNQVMPFTGVEGVPPFVQVFPAPAAPAPDSPFSVACSPLPAAPVSFVPFESPTLGFNLTYPEGWQPKEYDDYITFSPSEAGLDPSTSAGVIFWVGRMLDPLPVPDPNFPKEAPSFGTVNEVPLVIDSASWNSTQFKFETPCGPGMGLNAITTNAGYHYFLGAIAPAMHWNEIQPIFQEMLNSFHFAP